jgi:hypothetical protein
VTDLAVDVEGQDGVQDLDGVLLEDHVPEQVLRLRGGHLLLGWDRTGWIMGKEGGGSAMMAAVGFRLVLWLALR